jgi:hypothetical protein
MYTKLQRKQHTCTTQPSLKYRIQRDHWRLVGKILFLEIFDVAVVVFDEHGVRRSERELAITNLEDRSCVR